jgi:murein DD-endopeptidase MepM/ murein hydrolase activator NlpD
MAKDFTQPIDGAYGKTWKISSKMGWRIHPVHKTKKHHNGTDIIPLTSGPTYVHAIAGGRVVKARKSDAAGGGFGNYIVIRHYIDNEFYTSLYAHLEDGSTQVKPGQKVKVGHVLAKMGSTGMSTGKHLHIEIWKGRTHGWSSDGSGFIEPVGFIKTMGEAYSAKKSASVATDAKAEVQPVAVHQTVKKGAVKAKVAKVTVTLVAEKPTTKATPKPVTKSLFVNGKLDVNTWKAWQTAVKEFGYTGPIDGEPGKQTWSAIQKSLVGPGYSGPLDGIPGLNTYKALQTKLKNAKLYTGPIDGKPGSNTYKALQSLLNSGKY